MRRHEVRVEGELGDGQHRDAGYMGAQVTRDQLEVPNEETIQYHEESAPTSSTQEDELVILWKDYCAGQLLLNRWKIAETRNGAVKKFDFSPAVDPDIDAGSAIMLITSMMTHAGFHAWYPFNPYQRDKSLDNVDLLSVVKNVWVALDYLINKMEYEEAPDYRTPIKQRDMGDKAENEFWTRTGTALKQRREKMKSQIDPLRVKEEQKDELTPVTQRLHFSGVRESGEYQFKAMEALEQMTEREKIRVQSLALMKEEDLDSLLEFETGGRTNSGQALQLQTMGTNWEPKPFSNKDRSGSKARDWLKKFNIYVDIANLGKSQKCQMFEMYARGEVLDWYKQLMPSVKRDWDNLLKYFIMQFCEDDQSSMKKYYSAKQGEDQTPQQYFWKLNNLGRKAGKRIIGHEKKEHVAEHIQHYMDTLRDPRVRNELRTAVIARGSTMEAVEEALKDYTRYSQRDKGPSFKPALKLNKKPVAKVAALSTFSDDDSEEESVTYEMDRASISSEEDCGTKRVAFTDKSKTKQQKMISRNPCSHCGMENHTDDKCWKLIVCRHCSRNHPETYCNKVCKACGNVHEKGECALEKFYYQIKEWYDPGKHAGLLPKDLEETLKGDAC